MPVTIKPVDHPANAWKGDGVVSAETLLETACPKQWRRCQCIVQSSFSALADDNAHVTASENGFVWAAYHAYSDHHHLVIRPEDIWFGILTQLSFYINAHAEELRSFFVAHDDKKELEVELGWPDFSLFALKMADLIGKNVNDPQLRDWVMPDFSTTTYHDQVVGAVLFMGAMQAYFSYQFTVTCGLPSVTLLGTLEDWQKILHKLDIIDQLGEEPKRFANMLRPILKHMILTFEDPTSAEVTSFWNRIVSRHHVGSGTDYLSGWLTAFCFWNDKGEAKSLRKGWEGDKANVLFDEGVEYPYVDIDSIPLGYASVPVSVDDCGHKYNATLVAGSVGISASSSNSSVVPPAISTEQEILSTNETDAGAVILDTIQPFSGWWMYENEAPTQAEAREAEKKRLADALERQSLEMNNMNHDDRMAFYDSDRWNEYMKTSERLEELEAF